MPVLNNPKHELFAQELAKGKTADEAQNVSGHELTECDGLEGYYVYLLIDPRNDKVFYVGKGKNKRFAAHTREWLSGTIINAPKFEQIGDIIRSGRSVITKCFESGLSEADAFDLEFKLIETIGWSNLTNLSRGEQSDKTRAIAQLKDHISRIRPFCRWQLNILPQLSNSGMSAEKHEQFYWDLTGMLVEHLADLEGRPVKKLERIYRMDTAA